MHYKHRLQALTGRIQRGVTMAPTTKDTVLPSPPAQDSQAAQNAQPQAAPRTNPIGLEVPVVVHASRYSAATKGFSKPLPPVHEETRTVIVFEQGAVVRLTGNLSIGETVVLTNQQSGADVLCRVISVKAQPGIQNYVDLEFTQRAPGFWDKTANADASALRSVSPAPELAPKVIPTIPAPVEPSQQSAHEPPPAPSPSVSVESALSSPKPAPKPAPVEHSRVTTLGAQSELPMRPAPAQPTPVRSGSSAVSGASAGMQRGQLGEQTVLGGGLDWTKEAAARSNKGLIAAVAILAIGSLAGGAYFYTQRGHSEQQTREATVAAPSAPFQSATQPQANETPAPEPTRVDSANFSAESGEADTGPITPVPDAKPADASKPVRQELAAADLTKPVSTAPQVTKQTAPLRPAVQVGNLKAPVLKNAVISSSSEPPPTLSAQAAPRDILGTSGLSGASGPSAPAAPVAFASPEVPGQPAKPGGQLQMPKVISSPPPVYPDMARTQGVQGTVMMDALIDATGAVADVKVTSGPMVLRQAATTALRRWKYQPAQLNGQPTSVHMNVSINFTIH